MKIERFEVLNLSMPFDRPLTTGIHQFLGLENVVIKIHAEGVTGLGYAFCFDHHQANAITSMVHSLMEGLIGREVSNIRGIWNELWWKISFIGQAGPPVMALAAIDTALWDLFSKKQGVPLYKMLGAVRDEVPVYATGGWISYSNEDLVNEAAKYVEQGHTHYKIKVGQKDWRADVERVKLLRDEIGYKLEIMVDSNQAWTVQEAIRFGKATEEYDLYWFEEPINIHDLEGTKRVAENIPQQLATGETVYARPGFKPLIENGVADVLMPDLMRCGGPTEFMQIASLADSFNIAVSSHTFTEVSAHLMAAAPNGTLAEYIPGWWEELFDGAPAVKNGKIRLSNNPGLGFVLSEEALQKYRR